MSVTTSGQPAGRSPAGTTRRALLYALLAGLLLVFVVPLLWALSGSFKPRGDIFAYPPELIPSPSTLQNYRTLLREQPFLTWFTVSTVVAVISTVVSVGVCSLAGFGFAKYRFRGKRFLFNLMFSSLAIPFAVIVVPLFILLVRTGLDTPWFALTVPWIAPAFGIFMMRQYTEQSIPDELLEAARIDGCTEFATFRRVVLPLLRPALGALGVWSFINSYNSFLWPLVIIGNPERYTLPLGLATMFSTELRQYDLVLAGAVLATIPSLLVFILLRRQLIAGLTAGAVKH